jgi:hypothetical protein
MDDRRAQFLIAVADLCAAASLARLEVELRTRGDEVVRGIPHPRYAPAAGHEADGAERGRVVVIDDHILRLDELEECTIYSVRAHQPAGTASRAHPSG